MKLAVCPAIKRLRRGERRFAREFERFLAEAAASGIEPERIERLRQAALENSRKAYTEWICEEVFNWHKRRKVRP